MAPRSFFRGMLDDQLLPRVGDLLNVYSTPHAEFPEWARVACINNGGGGGYDVYEAPPCLVLRVSSVLDPANLSDDRECMRGYFLPDHAFTGKLKWRGKTGDDFVTTSPLAVAVEALPRCSESDGNGGAPGGGEEPPRRLTWTIPVPSELCTGLHWESAGMSPVPTSTSCGESSSRVRAGKVAIAVSRRTWGALRSSMWRSLHGVSL